MANEIRSSVSRGIQRTAEPAFDVQTTIEGSRNGDSGPAVTAGCEPKPQASAEAQAGARTRTKSAEEMVRSRFEGALKAVVAGESYEVVSDEDVNTAAVQLRELRASTDAQRAQVAQMRAQVDGEVKALEAKKGRTPADDLLLEGKRAQASFLGEVDRQLVAKNEGYEAAFAVVSDGVVTTGETAAIQQWSEAMQGKDQVLQAQAQIVDQRVALAMQAGGSAPAIPTVTTAAGQPVPGAPTAAPIATAQGVKSELTELRSQIGERRADLDILKSAPPKDPAARARHNAEVGLKEQELKLLQKRAADLSKAEEALQKGPLSDADNAALQTSKEQLVSQQKTLAAGKAAFDDVAALKEKMTNTEGSVAEYVASKREALDDANAALDRAQKRGNPEAIRAAFASAERAKAELGAATRSEALIGKTLQALGDGEIDAAEKKTLDGMQKAIDDAKGRAAAMEKRQADLDEQKHFGSNLADRVFSWASSGAETARAAWAYGRSVIGG